MCQPARCLYLSKCATQHKHWCTQHTTWHWCWQYLVPSQNRPRHTDSQHLIQAQDEPFLANDQHLYQVDPKLPQECTESDCSEPGTDSSSLSSTSSEDSAWFTDSDQQLRPRALINYNGTVLTRLHGHPQIWIFPNISISLGDEDEDMNYYEMNSFSDSDLSQSN